MNDMNVELPYAGTSGWSGTDTSEDRANEADASGTTARRQAEVLYLLDLRADRGMTVAELRQLAGWEHHGTSSGTLSVLHKTGRIARLVEKRGKCHVYVVPESVHGRDTQPHGRADTVTISRDEYERLTSLDQAVAS